MKTGKTLVELGTAVESYAEYVVTLALSSHQTISPCTKRFTTTEYEMKMLQEVEERF